MRLHLACKAHDFSRESPIDSSHRHCHVLRWHVHECFQIYGLSTGGLGIRSCTLQGDVLDVDVPSMATKGGHCSLSSCVGSSISSSRKRRRRIGSSSISSSKRTRRSTSRRSTSSSRSSSSTILRSRSGNIRVVVACRVSSRGASSSSSSSRHSRSSRSMGITLPFVSSSCSDNISGAVQVVSVV